MSGAAQMTCGLPVNGAACASTAETPTVVNHSPIASGTVKCSQKASVVVDVQLQLYFNGQWNPFGEHQEGPDSLAANTTYTFKTNPSFCPTSTGPNQPPPPDEYRTIFWYDSGAGQVTKTSPSVILTC